MMATLYYKKPDALVALQQREGRHAVIEASAGTGKTYTIEHIVADLLLRGEVKVNEVLVVTFTRAATADLKKKIRERLQELVRAWSGLEPGEVRTLDGGESQAGEPAALPGFGVVEAEGVERLKMALRSFDQASIYTIHGFCQRILVEHAFANKRLLEQEHVDGDQLVHRAISEALRQDVPADPELRYWLQAYLGAGKGLDTLRETLAGYVKTRGEYLPRVQVNLDALAASAQEGGAYFAALEGAAFDEELDALRPGGKKVHGGTRNAFKKHVRAMIEGFSSPPTGVLETKALLEGALAAPFKYLAGKKEHDVLVHMPELLRAVEALEELSFDVELCVVQALGPQIARRIEAIKQAEGVYTYEDMLTLVRDTLAADGEHGELLNVLRDRFSHAIIDEFQDTDEVQWEIFERLFVGGLAGAAPTQAHRLVLIGDPKQAIYGFRGGDVHTYLRARQRLLGEEAPIPLTQNFRSTPQVIGAYNAIFDQRAAQRVELGEGIGYAHPVSAGKAWFEAEVEGQRAPGVRVLNLKSEREKLSVSELRKGLARGIATRVRGLLRGEGAPGYPQEPGGDLVGQVGPEDIYVLCRRRSDGLMVAEALRSQGVPYAFLKMDGLFETQEARDVYDLLMALVDPQDRSRRARAWMTGFFELELGQLANLEAVSESEAIYQRLLRWAWLGEQRAYHALFQELIEASGLMRRRLLLDVSERELTNYQHLLELMAEECTRERLSMEELAARLKSYREGRAMPEGESGDQQRLEVESKAVQILTAHGSKGLQRGIVFVVPGFSDLISSRRKDYALKVPRESGGMRPVRWVASTSEMPPGWEELLIEQTRAEASRLNYVALTRAEVMLYLPYLEAESPAYSDNRDKRDPYFDVIDRLRAMRDEPTGAFLEWLDVDLDARAREVDLHQVQSTLGRVRLQGLELLAEERVAPDVLSTLMERRWEVTSFSSLRGQVGGEGLLDEAAAEVEKGDDARDDEVVFDPAFPGGMATGNFVHGVLETLEYARVRDYADEAAWVADEELQAFFEQHRSSFGADPSTLKPAMRAVYRTLLSRVEMPVAGEEALEALHRLNPERVRRELEFLFPIPELCEEEADGLRRKFGRGARVQGGFVKGFVDLLFEHQGKIYFADWKTNLVRSYDSPTLAGHVAANYAEQARLYTVALCRVLDMTCEADYEARFGGLFYFYVRGMHPQRPGEGIYRARPSWAQIVGFERSLHERIRRVKRGDEERAPVPGPQAEPV
ncbi:hypothetical protein DV096_20145 [Bradymonadaceae bacterium TMQ3]|nr:hypothetical protein DV096_20145 [Bradymonadaceae bacterium TMQ3]TXC67679.1 AAA family ATPase [Bradymonadales bacterium TMQ1]